MSGYRLGHAVLQGRRIIVLQKFYQRRCVCIRLFTLVGCVTIVNSASAQSANTYFSGGSQTSTRVESDPLTASRNERLSPSTTPIAAAECTSLQMIAPQAQAHIDYALNLAERGAVQSAQTEFIVALDLVADALDADTKNTARAHARAAQAGLTAIKETTDFVPADTRHNVVINLAQLASTHHTPVLKNVNVTNMTRAEALQRYHCFATQQLAFAGGKSAIASTALYGLGRAESVTTAGASNRNPLGAPNAMALYQAALMVDPQNYMASNELGVLMARFGDLRGAADQFEHSLSIKPQEEAWHNLAVVYGRMGQTEKARQAELERETLLAGPRTNGGTPKSATDLGARPNLLWVDVDTFASTTTPYGLDGPAVNANKPAPIAQRPSLSKRVIAKLNPWPKADSSEKNSGTAQMNPNAETPRVGDAGGRTVNR